MMSAGQFSLTGKKVWVAGHRGMVGSAILRQLQARGDVGEIITATHAELDLIRQADVEAFMAEHKPDLVIIAAAIVGGILANDTYPVDFLYKNLMIHVNVAGWMTLCGERPRPTALSSKLLCVRRRRSIFSFW